MKDVSADDVAEVIKKSRMTVFDYESGRSSPPISILLILCKYYDIDLNSLVLSNLESKINDTIFEVKESDQQYHKPEKLDELQKLRLKVEEHQRKIDELRSDIDILKYKSL